MSYYPEGPVGPIWAGNEAPKGVTTSKTCYQSRTGVNPTTTANMAFRNSKEGGVMPMQASTLVMGYTDIHGRSPTDVERGTGAPPRQGSKGA